jgi:ABC-type transporter MlaC component
VDYTVAFGEVEAGRRGRMEVPTKVRVRRRGRQEEVEVVYTLAERSGRWRVVDVETDGVSTVRNYRSQFRRIIDQDGFAALLERMRTRLAEGEVDL